MSDTRSQAPATEPTAASPLGALGTLIRWTLNQAGPALPLVIVVQIVLAASMILGFGMLIPNLDEKAALFLSTGTPTVMLLMVGFVVVPQNVATARNTGAFQYMRSLPVPRAMMFVADTVVWVLVAVPGVAVAVLVAQWAYGLDLTVDWVILLLGGLLVAVMGTAVGYAIAVTFAPMVAQILTQVLAFFLMLFSPVTYPASQMPEWFQRVHDFLPIEAGATLIRAGIASNHFTWEAKDLFVLALWTLLGVILSLRALTRRG